MRTRLRLYLDSLRSRLRRTFYVIVLVAANVAGLAAPAAAADGGSTVWRWMDVTDSHGNSAWGYSMSLDSGGWTDPGKAIFGTITAICWFIYQWLVIIAIWLINFALSLEWFQPLQEPASNIALGLKRILDASDLAVLMVALTCAAIGILIVTGKLAAAVVEWAIVLVILVLGTGVLSSPVTKAVGDDGTTDQVVQSAEGRGWLEQSAAAGLEIAGGIQKNGLDKADYDQHNIGLTGFADADQVRKDISQDLTDTFLRTPHQLINYGKILDGTKCEDAYDESLNTAPPPQPAFVKGETTNGKAIKIDPDDIPDKGEPGWDEWHAWITWVARAMGTDVDELTKEWIEKEGGWFTFEFGLTGGSPYDRAEPREIVAKCDEAAGERASDPSAAMLGDAATMTPGAAVLLAFGGSVALALIYCGVEFLWCCLRAIWDLIVALGPGNTRKGLWHTIATALWDLIAAVCISIFLVVFLLMITKVAEIFAGESIMKAFALVDVLLVAALFLFWRLRKRMRDAADATARMLSKRPGKTPARMPRRGITPGRAMAGYAGARMAGRAGGKAVKLGASAAAKGGIGAGVAMLGAGGVAMAGSAKAGKVARGMARRVRKGLGQKVPIDKSGEKRLPGPKELGERGVRPHGADGGADERADRRGLPTRGSKRRPSGKHHSPKFSGGSRTKFTSKRSEKADALRARLRKARQGHSTAAGPHPRGTYRADVINGITVYTPSDAVDTEDHNDDTD